MNNNPNFHKSIGTLFPATKTKPRSPDMLGKVNLQGPFLQELVNQIRETSGDQITCNIAVWFYLDKRCMSVELSPFYPAKRQLSENEITLNQFFTAIGENNNDPHQ